MWVYRTSTLHGDGTETPGPEIGLRDVTITKPLSQWQDLRGTLTRAADLEPGVTAIYACFGLVVVAGCIVDKIEEDGKGDAAVTALGFTSVVDGLPWTAPEERLYQANSGVVWGMIWDHVRNQPGGDLGMTRSPVTTGAWVGYQSGDVDQPYVLNARSDLWQSLGELLDDGIEYREEHTLTGDTYNHLLHGGAPIGDDRTGLVFEVGVNVTTPIAAERDAADSPTEIVVVGDADSTFWGRASIPDRRLRRVRRITIPSVTSDADAQARAEALLTTSRRAVSGYSITVMDHPLTPLTAVDVGDTITITGPSWSGNRTATARVSSITYSPDDGTAEFDVVPIGV